MMKIPSVDPDKNLSGTTLPIKRTREQPPNDVGPSQVMPDNGQDGDGGPPPKRKLPSQTAIADEVLDCTSPLQKTPARPRKQTSIAKKSPEEGSQDDLSRSKAPQSMPKKIPIPRSSRNRPAVNPTAASARSSRRTGPAPTLSGDSIPRSKKSASSETVTTLELSSRSPKIVAKPDVTASTETTAKSNPETSSQRSDDNSYVRIYGGDDGCSSGRSYWLMKAEPESRFEKGVDVKFSIDDLKDAKEPEPWDGVRNFQARNFMEEMKRGDLAFFYHSNCKPPGIVGIMEIVQEHSTDETANDPAHPYYDDRNQKTKNWVVVHVEFRAKFNYMISLKQLQDHTAAGKPLADMQVLRQKRLSVSRVSAEEWRFVLGLVDAASVADLSDSGELRVGT